MPTRKKIMIIITQLMIYSFPLPCNELPPLYVEQRLHMTNIPLSFGPNIMIMNERSEGRERGSEGPFPSPPRRSSQGPRLLILSWVGERESRRRSELQGGSAARAVVGWRSSWTTLPLDRRRAKERSWLPLDIFIFS